MPLATIGGFYAYGENKEYPPIMMLGIFFGLLYGIIALAFGGLLLAGTGGVTAFAIAPVFEIPAISGLVSALPLLGLFVGGFLVGFVNPHLGAFGRWVTDRALGFKLE